MSEETKPPEAAPAAGGLEPVPEPAPRCTMARSGAERDKKHPDRIELP